MEERKECVIRMGQAELSEREKNKGRLLIK